MAVSLKRKIDTKMKISQRIILVSLLPFLSNIAVVLTGYLTNPLIYTRREKIQVARAIKDTNSIFIFIAFFFAVAAVLIFMWPCLKWILSSKIEFRDKVRRRIVYMPLVLSFIGLAGWIIYSPAYFFGAVSQNLPIFTRAAFTFGVDKSLTGAMAFVLCYYPLELIVRKSLTPYFFPDGDFSTCRDSWRPSIRTRLFIMYFSVGVFPAYMLYGIILTMSAKGQIRGNLMPLTVALAVLLGLGLIITALISGLLHEPLVEMKRAMMRVKSGDLDVRVAVESNDEVGNLGEALNEMVCGLREKEYIKDAFGRMVDPNVRDHLLDGNIDLGGDLCEASVLFCDIRGFTALSEKLGPGRVVRMLNIYFDVFSACIMEESGIVNKYIGDAIMAIFGAPVPLENDADAAVSAAKRIESALIELNNDFATKEFPPLSIGIGVHSGPVLIGNIGSRVRMEYTAIGDTVNTAARVEKLCKKLEPNLLITDSTAKKLSGGFSPIFLTTEKVRGKVEPISIYTV